jgi:hypothetical protein
MEGIGLEPDVPGDRMFVTDFAAGGGAEKCRCVRKPARVSLRWRASAIIDLNGGGHAGRKDDARRQPRRLALRR